MKTQIDIFYTQSLIFQNLFDFGSANTFKAYDFAVKKALDFSLASKNVELSELFTRLIKEYYENIGNIEFKIDLVGLVYYEALQRAKDELSPFTDVLNSLGIYYDEDFKKTSFDIVDDDYEFRDEIKDKLYHLKLEVLESLSKTCKAVLKEIGVNVDEIIKDLCESQVQNLTFKDFQGFTHYLNVKMRHGFGLIELDKYGFTPKNLLHFLKARDVENFRGSFLCRKNLISFAKEHLEVILKCYEKGKAEYSVWLSKDKNLDINDLNQGNENKTNRILKCLTALFLMNIASTFFKQGGWVRINNIEATQEENERFRALLRERNTK